MARLMPQDKSTSTRSTSLDVYQFGFILFELLTHHSPHASTFTEEAIEAWKAETPFTIVRLSRHPLQLDQTLGLIL